MRLQKGRGASTKVNRISLKIAQPRFRAGQVHPEGDFFENGPDIKIFCGHVVRIRQESAVITSSHAKRHMYVDAEWAVIIRKNRIEVFHEQKLAAKVISRAGQFKIKATLS